VLGVAAADGWSVIIVAAAGGAVSALYGGWVAAGTALLAGLAGAGELLGRRRLQQGDPAGLRWLIGAQLGLLVFVCAYAWWRWHDFDAAAFWSLLPGLAQERITHELVTAGFDAELDRPLFLQTMNALMCVILAALTLLYQGGLAAYYAWEGPRVRQALLASPPPAG